MKDIKFEVLVIHLLDGTVFVISRKQEAVVFADMQKTMKDSYINDLNRKIGLFDVGGDSPLAA